MSGAPVVLSPSTTMCRLQSLNAAMDALLAEQAERRHLIYLPPPPLRHRGARYGGPKELKMETGMVRMIALEQLRLSEAGVRQRFDDDELSELARSIREKGMLQPLLVRPAGSMFEVAIGGRRFRAAQRAGLQEVPVIVRELDDAAATELSLIENLQREDLAPLEEAEGYRRMLELRGCTYRELAAAIGKSHSHISRMLMLLKLPETVRHHIEEGKLSVGHANALLSAPNPAELADEVVRRGLTVHQAESRLWNRPDNMRSVPRRRDCDADSVALERELGERLGLRVTLHPRRLGGVLLIRYENSEQLELVAGLLRAGSPPAAVAAQLESASEQRCTALLSDQKAFRYGVY
jgi:ParB family chromosome partitioning protein